jgi:DNA-binding GntR family transcriptional regulator
MVTNAPAAATISVTVYRRIRSDIIFGRLPPGQKLKLDQLKKDYDVSVGTLREILNRLSSEKLVLAEGQRGFEVMPVSREDLKEVAALRQLLEAHAIEQSFVNGDVEWEGYVVAAHHKLYSMEKRIMTGDRDETEQWKLYDWQFHQALISACGSRVLMETLAGVFDQYLRYQMLTLSNRGDISIREHRMLLDCALKRDAKTACRVLVAHINGGVKDAVAAGTI